MMIWIYTLCLCQLTIAASYRITDNTSALRYLAKYGYIAPREDLFGSLSIRSRRSIADFQRMTGLPPTGKLTEETIEVMNLPRCGVKDKIWTVKSNDRGKRFRLQGSKWPKNRLTYYQSSFTSQLDGETVRDTIKAAWKVWTDRANLTITEVFSPGLADMIVSFENGTHGDGFPFDGRGGVLAHAFFPERGGDCHFDDQENWSIGPSQVKGSVDLLFAATHEFGHSLGLSHSDIMDSIMAPIYRGYIPNLDLKPDDIRAIQALYGTPENGPDTPLTIPLYEHHGEDVPNLCLDAQIDGITTTQDGSTYIFKGDYYWELDTYGRLFLQPGYPQRIEDGWRDLIGNIDTVYTDNTGRTFFFKATAYWEFLNRVPVQGPADLQTRFAGLPSYIDAMFVWSGNNQTYGFKGEEYYRLQDDLSVASGYPRDSSYWTGLPQRVDAAFNFKGVRTYIFSGQVYYRFNDRGFNVDEDFPLSTAARWFGCRT